MLGSFVNAKMCKMMKCPPKRRDSGIFRAVTWYLTWRGIEYVLRYWVYLSPLLKCETNRGHAVLPSGFASSHEGLPCILPGLPYFFPIAGRLGEDGMLKDDGIEKSYAVQAFDPKVVRKRDVAFTPEWFMLPSERIEPVLR